jgi:hypothetical protein
MTKRSPIESLGLGGGFSVREARDRGISRSRLDAHDLIRPFWGTRQLATDATIADRCRALLSRLPDTAAISHSTAAMLWGAPLPARIDRQVVHVTVPIGIRAPEHRGSRGHQRELVDADIARPFGFRLTIPDRTWCDLAEQTTIPELVAAGDFFIHWEHPLSSTNTLETYSASHAMRRGVRVRRAAIPLLSDRAESYRESILRVAILQAGFSPPEVNYEIVDADGRLIARVDLAWPDRLVAVEYEGDHHRTDRVQWQRDLRRVEQLQDAGWRVVRVSADDLYAPAALLARLRRLL